MDMADNETIREADVRHEGVRSGGAPDSAGLATP
jgi:hypothetical protein